MDPLGAVPASVEVDSVARWNTTEVPEYDILVDDPSNMRQSPFKWDDKLNGKIALWCGELTELNAEAIVNSTNENLSDRNPLSERILKKAGIELKKELRQEVKACRTGEAKLTKGYNLQARYVIHTVGPRYNIKYKTAAESALFNSYRSVLQLVRENSISSLGLTCVHSLRRGYPPYEGAHIAIRTLRRFLEKHADCVETVAFVVTGDDEDIYLHLLPLYFPRSKSEEDFSAYHLPYDVGNEEGEPVIAERQIRIMGKPTLEAQRAGATSAEGLEESVDINAAFETSVAVGAHSFARMETDVDTQRKQRLNANMFDEAMRVEQQKRYDRWLRRAKKEDLSSIAALRCLYQSGFDKYGRAVIIFVGRNFPADKVNLEKALQYFVFTMDPVVNKKYVIVYLHTLTPKEHQPDSSFLKDIYNLCDVRYKRNLGAIYIVHPTFWSKVITWWFTTFSLSDIKPKVQHIPGLEYLFTRIPPDQLDLPQFVLDYDMQEYGTRYYDPEDDHAIGSL